MEIGQELIEEIGQEIIDGPIFIIFCFIGLMLIAWKLFLNRKK